MAGPGDTRPPLSLRRQFLGLQPHTRRSGIPAPHRSQRLEGSNQDLSSRRRRQVRIRVLPSEGVFLQSGPGCAAFRRGRRLAGRVPRRRGNRRTGRAGGGPVAGDGASRPGRPVSRVRAGGGPAGGGVPGAGGVSYPRGTGRSGVPGRSSGADRPGPQRELNGAYRVEEAARGC